MADLMKDWMTTYQGDEVYVTFNNSDQTTTLGIFETESEAQDVARTIGSVFVVHYVWVTVDGKSYYARWNSYTFLPNVFVKVN